MGRGGASGKQRMRDEVGAEREELWPAGRLPGKEKDSLSRRIWTQSPERREGERRVPMTAFGFRLRSCRCFWTMTHNKENILLYKRTNTYPASLKTSLTKYAPERMIFSFLICSTPLHSNPCSFIQKVLDSLSWSYHEHSTSHSLCGVFFSNFLKKLNPEK